MIKSNFQNIKNYKGSQNAAFEELCCQLASLEPHEEGAEWIRKEGSGGDAGVEGYWKLDNGKEEHCWQAKYFFELKDVQWRQIDRSIKAAIKGHPNMTRYVICLPINLTDQRQEGKNSQRPEWNKKIEEWGELSPNHNIEFELWDESKITNLLTENSEQNAGRIKYWFEQDHLTEKWYRERFEDAQADLGPRYTPDLNVELPISKVFHGLAHASHFRTTMLQRWEATSTYPSDNRIIEIKNKLKSVKNSVAQTLKQHSSNISFQEQSAQLKEIGYELQEINAPYKNKEDDSRYIQHLDGDIRQNWYLLSGYDGDDVPAAEGNILIITGQAGTGKSHLFADITNQFTQEGLPVVLLLGQQFNNVSDPWNQILQKLGLQNSNAEEFLGALNTAAQAKKVRALIMIDALNEGAGQALWQNHLAGFIEKIKRYPYVALAVSCRTPYEKCVIPENIREKHLSIPHRGFEGYEDEAAEIYLDGQGIARPSAPYFLPEFSNPLFLKTICDTLKKQRKTRVPVGLRGIEAIFEFYTSSLKNTIESRLGLDENQNLVNKAIKALIRAMNQRQKSYINKDEAIKIFDQILPSEGQRDKSLLAAFLDENFLFEDLIYENSKNTQGKDIIRFTFERFLDHFRAKHLLDQYKDSTQLANACASPNGGIYYLLSKYEFGYYGLLEALSIQVPEKYGRELLDFFPNSPLEDGFSFVADIEHQFGNSLLWRAPDKINDNTLKWINKIYPGGIDNINLTEILIRLATEPKHRLNALILDKKLKSLSLADRDASWSINITELWNGNLGVLKTLINWAWHGNTETAEKERIKLASITLTWFLSSPNRNLRDRATKALVSLLLNRVCLTRKLLLCFDKVNDPYILERIYAVAYGVAMHLDDAEGCAKLAQTVYNRIFRNNKPPAHILLRDYARGIIEKAAHMGSLPSHINLEKARPPYESEWPIIDPGVKAAEEMDDMGMVKLSVMDGDFGTYIMNDVFQFSATPRSEGQPKTCSELLTELENQTELSEALRNEKQRWLGSRRYTKDDGPAIFSRRLAKRWVVNRVKEMGWTKERFAEFERIYASYSGRAPKTSERMGKKYQWIAWYELLARMADSLWYGDNLRSNSSEGEFEIFTNPWDEFLRDIDPSYLIDDTKKQKLFPDSNWWRPNIAEIVADMSDEQIRQWIKETNDLPNIENLIQRTDNNNQEWLVLYSSLEQEADHEKNSYFAENPWGLMSILTQAYFAKKQDIKRIISHFESRYNNTPIGRIETYNDGGGNGCQGFLGEYSWHPAWIQANKQIDLHFSYDNSITFTGHKPIYEYALEKDNSISKRVDIKLPSPFVRSLLNLNTHNIINTVQFSEDDIPFLYKSNSNEYSAMIKKQNLIKQLNERNLDVVWISSIEKLLIGSKGDIGRLTNSTIVIYDNAKFTFYQWALLQREGEYETIREFEENNFS